jgi:hypothetical protein
MLGRLPGGMLGWLWGWLLGFCTRFHAGTCELARLGANFVGFFTKWPAKRENPDLRPLFSILKPSQRCG